MSPCQGDMRQRPHIPFSDERRNEHAYETSF
jgi:hypothetical protein